MGRIGRENFDFPKRQKNFFFFSDSGAFLIISKKAVTVL